MLSSSTNWEYFSRIKIRILTFLQVQKMIQTVGISKLEIFFLEMASELLIGEEIEALPALPCETCKKMFFKKDLNEHLWKHAEDRYNSLPQEKKFGRFRQLQKLAPKQFPIQ